VAALILRVNRIATVVKAMDVIKAIVISNIKSEIILRGCEILNVSQPY